MACHRSMTRFAKSPCFVKQCARTIQDSFPLMKSRKISYPAVYISILVGQDNGCANETFDD